MSCKETAVPTGEPPKYRIFEFEPSDYAAEYRRNGFVHVPGGASPEFMDYALRFANTKIDESGDAELGRWQFKGKKLQFLMEFEENSDYPQGLYQAVATVAGLDVERMMIGERHIKVYDPEADPAPPPHKDRMASEVTVGVGLDVPEDSRVILYPDHHLTVNPYQTTKEWRDTLDEQDLPENALAGLDPVEVDVRPGDVVMFAGASIYHERINGAGTSILYMKFNSMRLDPICEDPQTRPQRDLSLALLEVRSDAELLDTLVEVSPRLEKVTRQYSRRHWGEVLHGHIIGEREFRLSEAEFKALRVLDDRVVTLRELITRMGHPFQSALEIVPSLRRLIAVGAIDLRI